jgi:phosphate transport system permease protein
VALLGMTPLAALGFFLGRRRPLSAVATAEEFHSSPDYYGWYALVWMFAPALIVSMIALVLHTTGVLALIEIERPGLIVLGAWLALPALLLWPILRTIKPTLRARIIVERVVYGGLVLASLVSILTTVAITLSVLFEAIHFFAHEDVSVVEFFTSTVWSPQADFGVGQEDGSARFGSLPLFTGTFIITLIAMLVAVPIGVMSAVYMSEFAPRAVRRLAKPLLEVLAGIPTVVYGFFAAVTVSPAVVWLADGIDNYLLVPINHLLGLTGSSMWLLEATYSNGLSPGLIMGVMIIPFMSSLSDDVISAVPHDLRKGAFALGATEAEVVKRVVLPAAMPGIVSAFLISVSRAVGETMIVVMAASMQANQTVNPLHNMTTVTVQIVAMLTGDQRFDSPMTLSAFGLGLTLLLLTLILNVISAIVIRKFRQAYE